MFLILFPLLGYVWEFGARNELFNLSKTASPREWESVANEPLKNETSKRNVEVRTKHMILSY